MGRDYFGDQAVDGRIILKFVLGMWACKLDSASSGWGPVVASCDHSSELSGSIRGGEFLDR
jgi:hypothetical protein